MQTEQAVSQSRMEIEQAVWEWRRSRMEIEQAASEWKQSRMEIEQAVSEWKQSRLYRNGDRTSCIGMEIEQAVSEWRQNRLYRNGNRAGCIGMEIEQAVSEWRQNRLYRNGNRAGCIGMEIEQAVSEWRQNRLYRNAILPVHNNYPFTHPHDTMYMYMHSTQQRFCDKHDVDSALYQRMSTSQHPVVTTGVHTSSICTQVCRYAQSLPIRLEGVAYSLQHVEQHVLNNYRTSTLLKHCG